MPCEALAKQAVTIASGLALALIVPLTARRYRPVVGRLRCSERCESSAPPRHSERWPKVSVSSGGIWSPNIPSRTPCRTSFPRRNRIISGLSPAFWW
ncbi:DNA-processing protein DprA [Shigella flexneri]